MIDAPSQRRIALAHDWLVGMRGGERVLDRLARMFGPTRLYTLVNDGRPMSKAIDECRVVTSPLQKFPGASGRLRRWYLPLMPWAVGKLRVEPCDLLISTSSAVMKSIRPPMRADGARVPHLCYCHSPARYIWEQGNEYAIGRMGSLRSIGLRAVRRRFQAWDRRTVDRVDVFLANSRHTAARIERCFGRQASVVYPPVRTAYFTPGGSSQPREDWLLVVAALEPYKRTDLAIEVANRERLPLKVAGGGSQFERLKALAGPTVEMLGRVDDEQLRDLYRRARALVFPQMEDFGIVAAEAQACGCPVIAYRSGGAAEIITAHTGHLFDDQNADSLAEAVRHLDRAGIDPGACRENALRFSEDRFDAEIAGHVDALLACR